MANDGVSRRHFFYGSLLAGAVPLAGYGSVPSLRALGYKPFYEKLNVASIGCGGQGGADLNAAAATENIVARLTRNTSPSRAHTVLVSLQKRISEAKRDLRE